MFDFTCERYRRWLASPRKGPPRSACLPAADRARAGKGDELSCQALDVSCSSSDAENCKLIHASIAYCAPVGKVQ